jgi:hypothetical protein
MLKPEMTYKLKLLKVALSAYLPLPLPFACCCYLRWFLSQTPTSQTPTSRTTTPRITTSQTETPSATHSHYLLPLSSLLAVFTNLHSLKPTSRTTTSPTTSSPTTSSPTTTSHPTTPVSRSHAVCYYSSRC